MSRHRDPGAVAASRAMQQAQFELTRDEEDEQRWPNGVKKYARLTTRPTAAMQYVNHRVKVDDQGLVLTGLLRTMGLDVPARQRGSRRFADGWSTAPTQAPTQAPWPQREPTQAPWPQEEPEQAPWPQEEPKEEQKEEQKKEQMEPEQTEEPELKKEPSPTEQFTPVPSPITPDEPSRSRSRSRSPVREDPYA